jgi:hypothetical protein
LGIGKIKFVGNVPRVESGVALRFPPQSKFAPLLLRVFALK